MAGCADQAGCDVHDAVAPGADFGSCQLWVVGQGSSFIQAIRSVAVSTICSQAVLKAKSRQGRLRRPVFLAWRMRSCTRACWR